MRNGSQISRIRFLFPAVAALLVTLAGPVHAGTFYVDSRWTGTVIGSNPYYPFTKIKDAVASANLAPGSTILVAGTTYKSLLNGGKEDLGTEGIVIIVPTTIEGGYVGWQGSSSFDWTTRNLRTSDFDLTGAGTRAFFMAPTSAAGMVHISGFIFRNANHTKYGGAIACSNNAWSIPVWDTGMGISDCLFTNNVTTNDGGAAAIFGFAASSYAYVKNCDFINNRSTASSGGGLYFFSCFSGTKSYVSNCTFRGNSCAIEGGGLFVRLPQGGDSVTIGKCTFDSNSSALNGGGLFSRDGFDNQLTIRECVFKKNSALQGSAIGGIDYYNGEYVLQNCLIYSNYGGYAVMNNGFRSDGFHIDLAYCTIVDNPDGGVYCYPNTGSERRAGFRVRNSIIAYNGQLGIYYTSQGTNFPAATIQYNDVYGQTMDYSGDAAAGTTNGNVAIDPVFASRARNSYHLRNSSPCESIGTDIGIAYDLEGASRPHGAGYSIGCYELPDVPSGTLLVIR